MQVRPFSEADVADFLAYQGLPAVRRYQPGEAMTAEQASAFVAEQARQDATRRGVWHGRAVELVAERRVIGDVGLWVPASRRRPAVADLGFQIDPQYQGRGYALEALEAFLPVAVRDFTLDRITASCHDDNRSSWRLMERLGMRLCRRSNGEREYTLDLH
ncbi:GNAT family N-acetyltransferase [Curtobacterium sp. ISL-83]|uniref:GNAT family N-acetyltransferase n=1 Tax=Curtobacterium sp. ISL-83 TaxID=2819145 RepID=UPI001BE89F78|nr:GNAT family N-acetyltransferase [Curtobacterium sp. ISL-83]MBT2503578.1 GNAT family N-acetyltransferase [Curtobacterium sp. ISL-83]